jgi:hypothetical protein
MGDRTGTGITKTEAAMTVTAMTVTVMTNAVDLELAAPLVLHRFFLPRPSWIFFIIQDGLVLEGHDGQRGNGDIRFPESALVKKNI